MAVVAGSLVGCFVVTAISTVFLAGPLLGSGCFFLRGTFSALKAVHLDSLVLVWGQLVVVLG